MANWSRKIISPTRASTIAVGAEDWRHVDGSVTTPITVKTGGGRLVKVVLNTNGNTLRIRNGSAVIAAIANDAPEQTFYYGIFCNDDIIVECGGAVDATIVVD
jgi:hypothetical protein